MKLSFPETIIHEIIPKKGYFPNNALYPFLIYKNVFDLKNSSPNDVQTLLEDNGWRNTWVDEIYDYHHYHSNTHEVLVIFSGKGKIEIGGNNGKVFGIEMGDVVIFPAGVSHKSLHLSADFKCVGAYPFDIEYDMKYGNRDEHPEVDKNIKKVGLPKTDPIFSDDGLLFTYWR